MTAKYDYNLPASCRANLGYAYADADRTGARAEERIHRLLAHPDAMESVPIWSFFQSARRRRSDAGDHMTISRTLAGMCSKVLWRCTAGVLAGCVAGVILSLSTGRVGHALKVYPPAPFLAAGDGRAQVGIRTPNASYLLTSVARVHSIVIMNRATNRWRRDSLLSA